MTKEGVFKEAIQRKIGSTVDTSDIEKELAVLRTKLHQAEATRLWIEQQMDGLDVDSPHYDRKMTDLQKRLDGQYDMIDEVERAKVEVNARILEMEKGRDENQRRSTEIRAVLSGYLSGCALS